MSGFEFIPGVSVHARERMIERFGADLTRQQWLEVVGKIVNREAVLVSAMLTGKEYWLVEIGGLRIRVGWSPDAAIIMTVVDPSVMAITDFIQRNKHARMRKRPGPMERGFRSQWRVAQGD